MPDEVYLIELQPTSDDALPKVVDLRGLVTEMVAQGAVSDMATAIQESGSISFRENMRIMLRPNIWVGVNNSYGPSWPNWKQYLGNSEEPGFNWYHRGWFLKKGQSIKSITLAGRVNNPSVTDIKYNFTFRSGDWNNSLDSFAETDFDLVVEGEMDVSTPGHDQSLKHIDVDFTAPSDGVLMPAFRAVSSSKAVRYFYGNIVIGS